MKGPINLRGAYRRISGYDEITDIKFGFIVIR